MTGLTPAQRQPRLPKSLNLRALMNLFMSRLDEQTYTPLHNGHSLQQRNLLRYPSTGSISMSIVEA
jgi:hypothetical protein